MTAIPAIETRYKGYRFRSRLEARWAVFFDSADIPWQYEDQGYQTSAGPYLPDFVLWGDLCTEVKPPVSDATGGLEPPWLSRASTFVEETQRPLLLLLGVPAIQWQHVLRWYDFPPDVGWDWLDFGESIWKRRAWFSQTTQRPPCHKLKVHTLFRCAVDDARAARFEHGETPTVGGRRA